MHSGQDKGDYARRGSGNSEERDLARAGAITGTRELGVEKPAQPECRGSSGVECPP